MDGRVLEVKLELRSAFFCRPALVHHVPHDVGLLIQEDRLLVAPGEHLTEQGDHKQCDPFTLVGRPSEHLRRDERHANATPTARVLVLAIIGCQLSCRAVWRYGSNRKTTNHGNRDPPTSLASHACRETSTYLYLEVSRSNHPDIDTSKQTKFDFGGY